MLGVALTLIVAGITVFSILEARRIAVTEAGRQAENLARALDQHAGSAFGAVDVALDDIQGDAERDERKPNERKLWHALLQSQNELMPQTRNLAVINEAGALVAEATQYPPSGINASNREFFRFHASSPSRITRIGAPIRSLINNQWVIPVSRRIDKPDGRFGGVAVAIVDVSYFSNFYKTLDLGADGAISIFNGDIALLVREPVIESLLEKPPQMSALEEKLKESPQGAYLSEASPIDGARRIVAYRRVDQPPLVVTVGISMQRVLEPWRRDSIYIAAATSSFTALFLILLFALRHHLRRTAQTAEDLERTERDFRALYESATEGIFRASAEGQIVRANPAFIRMCGYETEEQLLAATARPGFDWYAAPDARSRFFETLKKDGHIHGFEQQIVRRDKTTLWVSENARAVKDLAGNVRFIEGTIVDITDRKKAEDAVRAERQAERFLAAAIESISEGIVIYDSDERFAMCNSTYRTFYTETTDLQKPGAKYEDLLRAAIARGQFALPPGTDVETFVQDRLTKFRGAGETMIRQIKDGRWLQISERRTPDGGVIRVTTDITALKHNEEARLDALRREREAENRLIGAIESISEGVVLYDAQERFVMCNSTYRSFYPDTADLQRPGTRFEELVRAAFLRGQSKLPSDTDVENHVRERLARFRNPGEPLIRHLKTGKWVQISERRTPDGGIVSITSDITILKKNEDRRLDALRREQTAQARLFDAIESISEGILLYDAEERFVLCNSRHRELHPETTDLHKPGVTFEELLRASVARGQVVLPFGLDTETFVQNRLRQFRNPGETIERQLVSGRWIQVNERRTPDGGIIRVTTDITPVKRHEEALIAAKEAAEAANQSKSNFLATMSHELRTPLHAILGLSEMIRDQTHGQGTASYAQYGRLIHDSGRHLLTLISDILDMSKIEAGRYELKEENVPLGGLVRSCLSIVATRAKAAGVAIGSESDEDGPVVRADRRAVTQVVLNLLSNGIKFTPAGGRVTVSAAAEPDGQAILRVRDTGIGIAPEDIERVMQPFAQVDPSHARKYEGTGLGLSISKRLMELHGGTIELVSSPGQGVTATIRFPRERVVQRV
ncbi:MAG: PAS-domain containing protein [Alphaproteobacteria bacterium]